jgi:hypothetical protein
MGKKRSNVWRVAVVLFLAIVALVINAPYQQATTAQALGLSWVAPIWAAPLMNLWLLIVLDAFLGVGIAIVALALFRYERG